jgi:hypothetical protein
LKKNLNAVDGDNILMLGQITASSPQMDSGEVDMLVSLNQCYREKIHEEIFCSSKSTKGKDLDLLQPMKSTNKRKLEEGEECVGMSTEEPIHDTIKNDCSKKRTKARDISEFHDT